MLVQVEQSRGAGGRHRIRRPAQRARPDGLARVLSGLGQTLLTLGVIVLLFCAYELWVTGLFTARTQTRLRQELTASWPHAGTPVPPVPGGPRGRPAVAAPSKGTGFALLFLPTLRGKEPLVVVEGVGISDLQKGPGHLPGSAQPGSPGNTVLSGHRTTYGAPFADLDRLRPGDPVVLQTSGRSATYRITGSQVVDPSATEVTYPVPGRPGVAPTSSLLTMTTCNPKYSARQRLVVSGLLVDDAPVPAPRAAAGG